MNLSTNVQLMLYVVLSIAVLFWIAMPLIGPRRRKQGDMDALQKERIEALLLALKKLHAAREHGGDEDNTNIENRLLLELAKLYAALGVDPHKTRDAHACSACDAKIDQHFAHCPACGAKLSSHFVPSAA